MCLFTKLIKNRSKLGEFFLFLILFPIRAHRKSIGEQLHFVFFYSRLQIETLCYLIDRFLPVIFIDLIGKYQRNYKAGSTEGVPGTESAVLERENE